MNGPGRPLRRGSAHGRAVAVGSAHGLGAEIVGRALERAPAAHEPAATTTRRKLER